MTRVSIPRLHSVRFKDGRAPLRVIRPAERGNLNAIFRKNAQEIAEVRPTMGGYAIVAWTADGATSVAVRTLGAPIPILMMPEFIKTCVADYVHSKESE